MNKYPKNNLLPRLKKLGFDVKNISLTFSSDSHPNASAYSYQPPQSQPQHQPPNMCMPTTTLNPNNLPLLKISAAELDNWSDFDEDDI